VVAGVQEVSRSKSTHKHRTGVSGGRPFLYPVFIHVEKGYGDAKWEYGLLLRRIPTVLCSVACSYSSLVVTQIQKMMILTFHSASAVQVDGEKTP